MSFTDQINSLSKSCHFHIRDLRRIRHLLLLSEATALANSLVSSKLDYSNSLYNDILQANLNKIQRIQNTLARFVTNTSKSEHITPILKKLHWLPIQQRIDYEPSLLTYFIIIICHYAVTNKNVFNCFSKETNVEFEFREYELRKGVPESWSSRPETSWPITVLHSHQWNKSSSADLCLLRAGTSSGVASMEQMEQLLYPNFLRSSPICPDPLSFLKVVCRRD